MYYVETLVDFAIILEIYRLGDKGSYLMYATQSRVIIISKSITPNLVQLITVSGSSDMALSYIKIIFIP
jgi:hypothetical protein